MKLHLHLLLLVVTALCYGCASGANTQEDSVSGSPRPRERQTVSSGGANISARGAIGGIQDIDGPRYEGDGGSDIRLAILAPETQGDVPSYLPLYVQGLLNNNFGRYSAITLIDRQNLDRIVAEQNIAAGGNYSDADFITIGNLTNTRFFLFGTIQRLSGGRYSLQLSITDSNTGIRRADYMRDGTLAQLEGTGTLINDASADLLTQMGIQLTNSGKQTLLAGNTTAVRAQTAQAQGIIAQATGQEVAALLNFSQSVAFDPSQMEALSRLTSLSSTISEGSISVRIVNDIQARNQWLEAFRETARFFNDHPPFEITFDPNLLQIGLTNYARGTADLGMRIALNPSESGFGALNTLLEGLDQTGRRSIWGFDEWPLGDINPKDSETVVFGGNSSFTYKVDVALLNEENKTLSRSTINLNTKQIRFSAGNRVVTPPAGALETVLFANVNAADLTPTLTIVITAVNGIPSRDLSASGYMRIDTGDLEERMRVVTAQQAQAERDAAERQAQTERQRAAQRIQEERQRAEQAQKGSAAFLNLLFGTGSYFVQKNYTDGLYIFLFEAMGATLATIGLVNRDKQGEKYKDSDGKEQTRNPRLQFGIGVGLYAVGAIYGIYAANIWPRTGFLSAGNPPLDIHLVSDNKGNAAVQLSYIKRF